jgi:hypothetical protein
MTTPDVSARMLAAAIDYHAMGFSLMPRPYAKKKCHAKWKTYQSSRASIDQIRQWFSGSPKNIAIIGGEVSGGLAIRDFDDADAYHRWAAAHPDLAANLPTVQTGKGYHVYFRTPSKTRSKKYADGELRAEGNYWLAPPSRHESGRMYEWLTRITEDIPVVDSRIFFGPAKVAERAQRAKSAERAQRVQIAKKIDVVEDGAFWCDAVAQSIPSLTGERNAKIFELARRLLAVHPSPSSIPDALKIEIFDAWWDHAEPIIGTPNYDLSLGDFLRALEKVQTPWGSSPLTDALDRAMALPAPDWVSARSSEAVRLLAVLLRELQRAAGDGDFYLSSHDAASLTGISPAMAYKHLQMFLRLKKIIITEAGVRNAKATRYRYIADDL